MIDVALHSLRYVLIFSIFFCFMLYPAYSMVGRGNLGHGRCTFPRHHGEEMKTLVNLNKYLITFSGDRTQNQLRQLCPCATTGVSMNDNNNLYLQ